MSNLLKVANNATGTLNGAIIDSDLALDLQAGEGALFPSTGDFMLSIDAEIVKCTSRATDTFTIVRAQEGTAAAGHNDNAICSLHITADIITRLGKQLWDADEDTGIEVEQSADEDIVRIKVAGVEAFHLDAAGQLTLAKVSRARAIRITSNQNIPDASWTHVFHNSEDLDNLNEFDSSAITGTADATEALKLHDADGGFSASDVGKTVWNTTDDTYAEVTAFVDSGELTLDTDIMVSGEGYTLFFSRFTATNAGYYLIAGHNTLSTLAADSKIICTAQKNGAIIAMGRTGIGGANVAGQSYACIIYLAANDYITALVYHNSGTILSLGATGGYNQQSIHRLS